jgi:hypothetical protein
MSPNWLNVAGCDVLSTEGAKVSSLFDIGQQNKYFTDYRNQNKSSQKLGGSWLEEETPFPTNIRWCNGKAPIVLNLE